MVAEATASATHTGKIKSSKRITKALQDIITGGEPKEYRFEDGSVGMLQPSMAKVMMDKYYSLSPFEQSRAAQYMRGSYKNFLRAVKGQ
jgi:hypothetical protein